MEMKKVKLSDIGKIVGGATPLTSDSENYNGDIVWITPNDLSINTSVYIEKGEKSISEKGLKSIGGKLLPKGTVLFSSRAPIGYVAIAKNQLCTNQGFKSIIPNENKIDSGYLYYLLKQSKDYIAKKGGGTTFPEVSGKTMENIELYIPSLKDQQKIVKPLLFIENKIELNQKINSELESTIKDIYDYWFVQFDFPNEEGKPYKSSGGEMVWNEKLKREIPKGWEVCVLGDMIEKIESGRRPQGGVDKDLRSGVPSLGAECIEKLGRFDFNKTPYLPEEYRDKIKIGIIEQNDILLYKDGAYVGKTTLFRDSFPYEYALVNEHVFLLNTYNSMQEYLFYTLQQNLYFNIMQRIGNAKAAQPGLNKDDVCNMLIIKPTKEICENFHQIVDKLHERLFKAANQNKELTSLRDFLLPMLMNGQIKIKE